MIARKNVLAVTLHADPAWSGLYRIGGVCLIITGPLYIMGAILSVVIGGAPDATEAYMKALTDHVLASQINFGIFIVTDLLLIPAAMALYLAFREAAKNVMLIAVALLLVYIVVDLAVTEMNSVAVVTLAQQYAAATSEAQQAAYLAAVNFPLATLPLATFFSYVVSCISWLMITLVMLKAGFNKPISYLGILAFVAGIVGGFYVVLPVLANFLLPCLLAFGVWTVLVGVRLMNLGAPLPVEAQGVVAAAR